MRSHSLGPMAPLKTRRSVPRLTPLNSVRTRAIPGRNGGRRACRSSTTPDFAYQTARATWVLPVERRVFMLRASSWV
jgi:hypothetical protein